MNSTEQVTARILALVPDYAVPLESLRRDWSPDDPSLCMRLAALVWWIVEASRNGRTEFGGLSEYLDELLDCTEWDVRDAVLTCYLESLVNRVPEEIPKYKLDTLLGPKARQLAESWLNP